MAYRVELTEEADAQLAALGRKIERQITRKLRTLADNPRPAGAARLEEAEHLYRLRSGDYRILYQIRDEILLVLVVRIRHRSVVYRRLPKRRPMDGG